MAKETIEQRVKKATAKLAEANSKLYLLEQDEEHPQVLGPPATAEQIEKVSRLLGAPLPPSYAAFLREHNGWSHFTGAAMLLPTDEYGKDWVAKRIQRFRDHCAEFHEEISLEPAFFIMLGKDEPDFVYLDKSAPGKNGELSVVHFDMIEGQLGRYPDFAAFLEDELDTVEELIAEA